MLRGFWTYEERWFAGEGHRKSPREDASAMKNAPQLRKLQGACAENNERI